MPKLLSQDDAEAVVYVHAPHWSKATVTVRTPIWVLTREDVEADMDEDDASSAETDTDDTQWFLRRTVEMPVEHMKLKRYLSHDDTKKVEEVIIGELKFKSGGRKKIPPKQMARYKTLGYTVRVLEITNEDGAQFPILESTFKKLLEADAQFLDAAIQALDEPVTPILLVDIAAARDRAASLEDKIARGFQLAPEDEQYLDLDDDQQASAVSRQETFRPALRAVSGQD